MYRAVALAALQRDLSWNNNQQIADMVGEIRIEFRGAQGLLDGRDVSQQIRSAEVTSVVHHVADNVEVRRQLVAWQRQASIEKDIVSEGRDQGTVVFPDAECKFFLTASPHERARRRLDESLDRGESVSLAEVLAQQNQRDQRDSERPVGQLVKATDAIEIVTDGMSPNQVLDKLEVLVRERMSGQCSQR
jgi:cytidylate kinase